MAVKKDYPFDKTPPMAHLPTHTNTTDLERRIVYIQRHRCAQRKKGWETERKKERKEH